MKNIFRLTYLLFLMWLIETIIQRIAFSKIAKTILSTDFNNSIYIITSLFIFSCIIIYWAYSIFEQLFLFRNQGSKLNVSKPETIKENI